MGMETEVATGEEIPPQPRSSRGRGDQGTTINLGPRDELVGRLVYDGDLRVGGTFEGEATLSGDVAVEGDGTAKARFEARNMSIRGTFEGEANIRERLLIAGSGTASGTVRVSRLVIEDGALLNGNITMERPGAGLSPNGPIP
jgi:cytoskeletal protein CcmA (bactofilin family)